VSDSLDTACAPRLHNNCLFTQLHLRHVQRTLVACCVHRSVVWLFALSRTDAQRGSTPFVGSWSLLADEWFCWAYHRAAVASRCSVEIHGGSRTSIRRTPGRYCTTQLRSMGMYHEGVGSYSTLSSLTGVSTLSSGLPIWSGVAAKAVSGVRVYAGWPGVANVRRTAFCCSR